MRLIQFNSGLRVVLKDVQPHQTEPQQRYYLAAAPLPLPHHSSNSSIATTSSSIKSNGSTSTNAEYYIHRPYPAGSQSTVYYQYTHMKTPPVANATPATSLIVEVGRVQPNRSRRLTIAVLICARSSVFAREIDTSGFVWPCFHWCRIREARVDQLTSRTFISSLFLFENNCSCLCLESTRQKRFGSCQYSWWWRRSLDLCSR